MISKIFSGSKNRSILLMISACACFAAMTSIMNFGCSRLSSMQIIFSRGLVDTLIVVPILLSQKVNLLGNNPWRLLTRGTLGVGGASCIFWASLHMPIANAAALFRTTPLFMPFFAYLILKEQLYLRNVILSIFGFAGVILILKPQSDYAVSYAGLIAVFGAFINSLAFVTVKHLSSREKPLSIMLYFFVLSIVYPLIFASSSFLMPAGSEWIYLLIVGLFGFAGQYLMTWSFVSASAGVVTPWTYFEIVFSALFGFILLNQTIDLITLLGVLIIFYSASKIKIPEGKTPRV